MLRLPSKEELEYATWEVNRIVQRGVLLRKTLTLFRALLFGLLAASTWAWINPQSEVQQFYLLAVCLGIGIFQVVTLREKKPIATNQIDLQAQILAADAAKSKRNVIESLDRHIVHVRGVERHRLLAHASTLAIPLLVMIPLSLVTPLSVGQTISNVGRVIASLNQGVTLQVMQGHTNEDMLSPIQLNQRSPAKIELLPENMIQITVRGSVAPDAYFTVNLHKVDRKKESDGYQKEVFQSFQIQPERSNLDENTDSGTFRVSFAVTETVAIKIPQYSGDDVLAWITVKRPPVPIVELKLRNKIPEDEPWPDDQPLPLHIDVDATKPLRLVRLLISSGRSNAKETVSNVLAEDKTELAVNYDLILESYVNSDIAEVEIIAEAIDRSVPIPLVGRSQPIRIQTASAYGRYRQTLSTLRSIKAELDRVVAEQAKEISDEATKTMDRALRQAGQSPFFDSLDRMDLHRFGRTLVSLDKSFQAVTALQLSSDLNDFLFEHEALDDRERDRDFFVAIRSLSRLIETPKKERALEVPELTSRITKFVDERQKRWEKRVDRLEKNLRPKAWQQVKKKAFQKSLKKVTHNDSKDTNTGRNQALAELSKTAADYRKWLEALEAAEDSARKKQEEERKQGLASAQNKMRELQKRQGTISSALDRADYQDKTKLNDEWPTNRMRQNKNVKDGTKLENQIRALSPMASGRMKAALEAMNQTLESGNGEKFTAAESYSDLAGRLLRQAQNDAARDQRKRRSQRGRRRRQPGDSYYGRSVAGGDVEIQRDYQVDKRYREAILDEVRDSLSSDEEGEEDRRVMETYLRSVVR